VIITDIKLDQYLIYWTFIRNNMKCNVKIKTVYMSKNDSFEIYLQNNNNNNTQE